jgi:hypothetical protein
MHVYWYKKRSIRNKRILSTSRLQIIIIYALMHGKSKSSKEGYDKEGHSCSHKTYSANK